MKDTQKEISRIFGNKLRVRICGICFREDKILLIRHEPLGEKGVLWAPPGGGMAYGETAPQCLQREMLEETGLTVSVGNLLFVNEYMANPLHAIELFFETRVTGGSLKQGTDPEMNSKNQIIKEVRFVELKEIERMDRKILHNLFSHATSKEEILNLSGYIF